AGHHFLKGTAFVSPALPLIVAGASGTLLAGCGIPRSRRRIHRALHGKADLSILVDIEDFDLDRLILRHIIANLLDEGGGYLGNMYHSRASSGQFHKRTEFCDPRHFSFQDHSYLKLHKPVLRSEEHTSELQSRFEIVC